MEDLTSCASMLIPPFYTLHIGPTLVVLCSSHGGCYTLDTLGCYLMIGHKMKRLQRVEILERCAAAGVAEKRASIVCPRDGTPALTSLPVLAGYQYSASSCREMSVSEKSIQIHCRAAHKWSSGARGRRPQQSDRRSATLPYGEVALQTL